ncbi:MAG: hypothetical protein RR356_02490, partial [Bacteroidales bacterium]
MKKIVTILLLTVAGSMGVFAQDDAQFTLFPWAASYYNAGAIGEQSNTLCFTGIYKQQYIGYKDVYVDEQGKTQVEKTSPYQFLFNIESYLR